MNQSSVTNFLKTQYKNIFQNPNQALNNIFFDFTKKIDQEKNTSNLYQRFIRNNQNILQAEINKAETIDAINKIASDEIKYFYFSLKPVVNKLQHDEFTIEKVFEKSKDKRLMKLMSYPEEKFSDAAQQFVNDIVIPEIKKSAGLDKPVEAPVEPQTPQTTTERIKYNVLRILEADEVNPETDLVKYKQSTINWFNISLFQLLRPKYQLLRQLSTNTINTVDQLSKQMKGTNNENAKKMILNKVVNMNKEELQNLVTSLGLNVDEIGQL